MYLILLIVVILLLFGGGFSGYGPWSQPTWGHGSIGLGAVLVIVLLVLLLSGRL